MTTHSQKFLQQRRFYMVLPLLTLPFITMIFWALGGGQVTAVQANAKEQNGLNLDLPGAHFSKDDELWDKFKLYELAKRDSVRYEEAKRNDPYYVMTSLTGENVSADTLPDKQSKLNASLGSKNRYAQIQENEKQISEKLEELNRHLNQSDLVSAHQMPKISQPVQRDAMSEDVDRLEQMMEFMAGDSINAEMTQLGNVLDKIIDIQHPERLQASAIRPDRNVFEVMVAKQPDNISLLDGKEEADSVFDSTKLMDVIDEFAEPQNGFFGLEEDMDDNRENANGIEAVIHHTQTIVAGSMIKMRLLSDVTINGNQIVRGTFMYGTCSMNAERLIISITSIRSRYEVLPVALKVYDMDGMEGIYIPGAITRDAAKQATSQSVQDIQLYSMDNNLGVQAASAGMEAAKGLFSKRAKLIKITLKAGHRILIRDAHTNHS